MCLISINRFESIYFDMSYYKLRRDLIRCRIKCLHIISKYQIAVSCAMHTYAPCHRSQKHEVNNKLQCCFFQYHTLFYIYAVRSLQYKCIRVQICLNIILYRIKYRNVFYRIKKICILCIL